MRGVAIHLVAVAMLAACGGHEDAGPTELPPGEIEWTSLVPSTFRAAYPEPAKLVIRDPVAYAKLWNTVAAEMAPIPAPPAVAFSSEMVLAICLGPGPSGRAVGLRSVERLGDEIVVTYGVREGKAGGPETRSGPCAIVSVPRTDLPVTWRREGEEPK